jgi:hypothetical protein
MKETLYLPLLSIPIIILGCGESSSNIQGSNSQLIRIVDNKYTDSNETVEFIKEKCGIGGGLAILKGTDLNGNNQLDLENRDEVDLNTSQLICNGQDSIVTDVLNSNLSKDKYQTELESKCGANGGAVLVHGYDGDGDGKLMIANIEGTNKYLVEGTKSKDVVDEIYKYSILCNSKDLYFQLNDANNTFTVISGNHQETMTIKDGFSPIITVLEANKSNECNETGGFSITEEDNKTTSICNGESPIVLDMNSSQVSESCGSVGSTKGYFIIDINGTKYPVCQPASLESVALGKTADGNLTVVGSQLSVQIPKETTIFTDINDSQCSNGAIKVTSFIDYNLNNIIDINLSSETSSAKNYFFCKLGVAVQPTKPKVTAVYLYKDNKSTDLNKSLDFNFSLGMNPATINSSTVWLECNNSRVSGYVDFNISDQNPKHFQYVHELEDNMSYVCSFTLFKYIEDLNGIRLAENNITEINISLIK